MKRILSLFLISILSFFAFSYIDEYENLIVPLFKGNADPNVRLLDERMDREKLRQFLIKFNDSLSEVYLNADRSKISALPVSPLIKEEIENEIIYLKRLGWTMEMIPHGLEVKKVDKFPPLSLQVKVREKTRVRYRSADDKTLSSFSDKEYGVHYFLELGREDYTINSYEVLPLEDLEGAGG